MNWFNIIVGICCLVMFVVIICYLIDYDNFEFPEFFIGIMTFVVGVMNIYAGFTHEPDVNDLKNETARYEYKCIKENGVFIPKDSTLIWN